MRLRALALLVLALGAASAQVVVPAAVGYADFIPVGRDAAARVLAQAAETDLLLGVRGSVGTIATETVNVGLSGARLIGYGGAVAVSTAVIGAGLNWYMQQAQNAIDGDAPVLRGIRDMVPKNATQGARQAECAVQRHSGPPNEEWGATATRQINGNYGDLGSAIVGDYASALGACDGFIATAVRNNIIDAATKRTGSSPGQYANDVYLTYSPMSPCTTRPLVIDAILGYKDMCSGVNNPPNPAILPEIKKVVTQYIRTQPVTSASISSGDLLPGVQLVPVPTADQVAGKSGAALPYVVSVDTSTVRNPDASTSKITETKRSDGSRTTHAVRTTTTQKINTDGSATTITTTATTDTEFLPDGSTSGTPSTSTKTDSETTLPPKVAVPSPDQPSCIANGGTWSGSACTGERPKDEPCPVGSSMVALKCEEDKAKDPGDICGDFSLGRALHHPGSYLRDVFVPCEALEDLIQPSLTLLKTKFPFSLAASLNGWFDGAGVASAGSVTALPSMLGPIPLEWGWLSSLWVLIKTLVGVALWCWFTYWLVDRFTPRTQI